MRRRELLKALGAAGAAAAGLPWAAGCGRKHERRPSIVLFVADQMRADVVGAYGGRNLATPNLDRLAAEGATFERALSTYPMCTPYRGMLMTGRGPMHSGVLVNRVEVSPEQNPNCLGNVFAEAGYDTAYVGKWHLAAGARKYAGLVRRGDRAPERERRSEPEFVPPGPARLGFRHWEAYNYHHDFNDYWFYRDEPTKLYAAGFETDVQTDQALAYLRGRERDGRPFLLVVSPHPPHPPFVPASTPPGSLAKVPSDVHWRPNVPADYPGRTSPLAARCYLAMCANVDRNVGRLLGFLDASPLGPSTVFVFTSDHGEMLGSHGRRNKMVPYTEAVRVPLLVRCPGSVRAGHRVEALQTPVDHLPTLCALAGVPAPGEAEGLDLSAEARGVAVASPVRDAALLMNCVSHFSFFQTATDFPEWRGVRTERHTYVRWLDGREELYDDREDPYQLRDLARIRGARGLLDDLRQRLKELLAEADDEFLPGTAYAQWYDGERNLVRTALGPVG